MISEFKFSLNINREQALLYYQGKVCSIIVRAENGKKIQFPVQHIRPYIDQKVVSPKVCLAELKNLPFVVIET